jgi:hypothetical protein
LQALHLQLYEKPTDTSYSYQLNVMRRASPSSLSVLVTHLILVRIAALPEPEPEELLINVLWLLPTCHSRLIAVCQPVAAGVWCVDLREKKIRKDFSATARTSVTSMTCLVLQVDIAQHRKTNPRPGA